MTTEQLKSRLKNKNLLQDKAFIDGKWVQNSAVLDVLNPASGAVLAQVTDCDAALTHQAIEAAQKAQKGWAARTAKERGELLEKWYELIIRNKDDLGTIMTAEQGKPLREAVGEVVYGAEFVKWFAEEGKRIYGDVIPNTMPGTRIMTLKQPVGVCAMITPWNFPSAMITRKMPPALAAGCSVICKPAEATPLSALALAALAQEAGIPDGVINIVPSNQSAVVGKVFCDSPVIRKLSFTGSTKVGKILMAQCAGTVKKLSLELGGNAPFIVFDDADLEAAVTGAAMAKFRNCGQVCIAPNRFYVQEGIYDAFAAKLAEKAQSVTAGDGFDEASDIGPLINQAGVDKVETHVKDALSKGAELKAGGKAHALGGTFFEPTVLTGMNADMMIAQDETFGPVAALFPFKDEADVIAKANDTIYGLAAYFFSRDIGRVWRVAEALEYGMVGVNSGIISNEVAPFGGVKQSGFGREGSKYGIDDYVDIKYVLMGGLG
ncbi:MAG: NAD-dependent succinate-semialdehyde dehydrogenase [Alphaproteobacteria bacterium]